MPSNLRGRFLSGVASFVGSASRNSDGSAAPSAPAMTGAAQGQNTAPGQILMAQVAGMSRSPFRVARSGKPKRRKLSRSTASAPRKRKASRSRPARLVKGSRAAKAYMAKIRRKRKR